MAQLSDAEIVGSVIDMARLQSICVAAASLWGADVRLLIQKSQQEIEHGIECGVSVREPAISAAIAVCNAFHTADPYQYLAGVDSKQFRQRTFGEAGMTTAIHDHTLDAMRYAVQGLNARIK